MGGLLAGRLLAHLMKASGLVASGRVTSAEAWDVSPSCALQQRGKKGQKRDETVLTLVLGFQHRKNHDTCIWFLLAWASSRENLSVIGHGGRQEKIPRVSIHVHSQPLLVSRLGETVRTKSVLK